MHRLPLFVALGLSGCVSGIHQERIARAMSHPAVTVAALAPFALPAAAYPSIGGDILRGTSPEEQAAVRARAEREDAQSEAAGPK